MKISISHLGGALLLSTAILATLLSPSLHSAKTPSASSTDASSTDASSTDASSTGGFTALQANRAPQAPELRGGRWFNTLNDKPLTLASRRGEVTIVEFWTFACSNCRANLPAYARWEKQFAAQGVKVIGIHTPETDYERDPNNVARFLKQQGITYPVVTDENGQNWRTWKQQYWPTVYLIDRAGRVRHTHIGELRGDEAAVTARIETLLKEQAPRRS